MSRKIVPHSMWSFPSVRLPFSLVEEDEEDGWLQDFSDPSGLSVSEDNEHVYIEAHLPGIQAKDIDMTYDNGSLWIKGEKREESENKSKKYYRKAISTFSYRVAVPGNIDEDKEPQAICKEGILKVKFQKNRKSHPKKIPIKSS